MQRKMRREVSTYTMKLVPVVVIALVFSCSALANGNVESKASPVELEEQLGDIAAKESRYFLSASEFVEDSSGGKNFLACNSKKNCDASTMQAFYSFS